MNNQNKKGPQAKSVIEALRNIGAGAGETFKNELVTPLGKDFASQIFGRRSYSGEIMAGEALEMQEVYTGKRQNAEKEQRLMIIERQLIKEEQVLIQKRTGELMLQIHAIREEMIKLVKVTPKLSREVQIAAIQVSTTPSTYELFFLQNLFEFIKSFREKIESSNVWLNATNKRAAKRGAWTANYKKYGAKYLLSSEHYLSRSAA